MLDAEHISGEELARRSAAPPDDVLAWRSLGLIGKPGTDSFSPDDIERVRLIQLCLRRGISIEAIVRAEQQTHGFLRRYVGLAFPKGVGGASSLADAAANAGLDIGLARRIREASGVADVEDPVTADDADMLRACRAALDGGFPEEALLQVVRVADDSLGRLAETEARLFHYYVHERLRAAGMSGAELLDTTQVASDRLLPLIEPTILYFHRKGLGHALREDMLLHIEEEIDAAAEPAVPGQVDAAILFVDLSSFTPLTEAMGDAAAADVLNRFSAIVRDIARRHDGRTVKQIGDAFMLVFPDAAFAVDAGLEIDRRAREEPLFPAVRSGIQWGSVLYREGDYVGTNVNIAARLASEAGPHEVLVTAAVRELARGDRVVFEPAGSRRLKGIVDELGLFTARDAAATATSKERDPVCGMELAAEDVAARQSLEHEGRELAFCSDECLRRYIAAPERYSLRR